MEIRHVIDRTDPDGGIHGHTEKRTDETSPWVRLHSDWVQFRAPKWLAGNDQALDAIIAANPEQFEKAKGEPKVIQWFVGQTMKATQGKAKPPVVIQKMQERIAAA